MQRNYGKDNRTQPATLSSSVLEETIQWKYAYILSTLVS